MEAIKEIIPNSDIFKDSDVKLHFLSDNKEYMELYIRSDKAHDKGFTFSNNEKSESKTETCKFCGSTLYYYYLKNPAIKSRLLLMPYLEKCNCKEAESYWKKTEEKKEKKKEIEERQESNKLMKRKIENIFSISGIESRFKLRTFETFEVNETNRQAYETAKQYADKFVDEILPKQKGETNIKIPLRLKNCLFITGSYGTGKTHLACAIANQLMSNKISVICMTMIKLLDRIKASFNSNKDVTEGYILKTFTEVPLLVIDDLGSEQITEWSISKIFSIVNSRYETYMPTIITTNYGSNELIKRLTPLQTKDETNSAKTLDRLKEISIGVEMNWESYRTKIK